jgi:hypothetical protein
MCGFCLRYYGFMMMLRPPRWEKCGGEQKQKLTSPMLEQKVVIFGGSASSLHQLTLTTAAAAVCVPA